MISAPPPGVVENGDGEEEDTKSVLCLQDEDDIVVTYNVMEVLLGKENYNILLSALCSVKDTTLRNKGLAAFFAKNKSFRSVECQTDEEERPPVPDNQPDEIIQHIDTSDAPQAYCMPVQVVSSTASNNVSFSHTPLPVPLQPQPQPQPPLNILLPKTSHPVSHVTIMNPTPKVTSSVNLALSDSIPKSMSLNIPPKNKPPGPKITTLTSPVVATSSHRVASEPTLSNTIAKLTSCIVSSDKSPAKIIPSPINTVTKLIPCVVSSTPHKASTNISTLISPSPVKVITKVTSPGTRRAVIKKSNPCNMIILPPSSANNKSTVGSSQPSGTVPPSQASGRVPSSQPIGTVPSSQSSGTGPSSQPSDTVPSSQPSGTLPSSQPSGTLPSSQPIGTLPSSQPSGTLPSSQPSGTVPSSQPSGTVPSSQPSGTVSSPQPPPSSSSSPQPSPAEGGTASSLPSDPNQPADLKKELEYDAKGLLEIHRAVIAQDTDSVWMCGENLKRLGCSVDQRTKPEGFTALQLALVRGCSLPLIRVLLWLGADPLARDGRGRPTLFLALQPPHRSQSQTTLRPSARYLIRLLATEHSATFEKACAQTDNQGLTVLMHCAIKSWVDGMRLLLFHMPPRLVDTQLASTGMTALHMAMLTYSTVLDNGLPSDGSLRCITLLQRSGASDRIPDVEGVTPRQLARTPLIELSPRKSCKRPAANSSFSIRRPNIENQKAKHIKLSGGLMRRKRMSEPITVHREAATPKITSESKNKQNTTSTVHASTSPPRKKYSYVMYCQNKVRLRRTITDIMKDKTFQPVVVLKKNIVQSTTSTNIGNKQSKQKIMNERPQWKVQFKLPKIKKSPINSNGTHPPLKVKSQRVSNRSKDDPCNSPHVAGDTQNINVATQNGNSDVSTCSQQVIPLGDNTRSAVSWTKGCSSNTLMALSPKKKWLSRNNKWTEKGGSPSDKLKKNILSSIGKKKRRYSLESIGHDVEIIKQAVALQDQGSQCVS